MNTNTFKTYKVRTANANYLVVNEGTSKLTGERMLKVRRMRLVGYYGDHTPKAEWSYESPVWIKASLVVG